MPRGLYKMAVFLYNVSMKQPKIHLYFDVVALGLLGLCLATAVILLVFSPSAFAAFIDEDGIVEWLTVIGLLGCAVLSGIRFFRLKPYKKKLFLFFILLTALVFVFGAGEEISWGQRIFNIESGDFFNSHNTQKETNIHNLVFGGVRLNKLIFSLLMGVAVFFFLFILPLLYRKIPKIKELAGLLAVPVPQTFQVIAYIALFLFIGIIKDPRKWELLEMGGALLFFSIIQNPLNRDDFVPPASGEY